MASCLFVLPRNDLCQFDEFLLLIAGFQAERERREMKRVEMMDVNAERNWDRSVLEWGLPMGRFLGSENMKRKSFY